MAMTSRLLLIACTTEYSSPWVRTQRGDSAVEVIGLGVGEKLEVEMQPPGGVSIDSNGVFPIPLGSSIRVAKRVSLGSPTFVSVING